MAEKNSTILAIDDDPDILTVLKANLELYGFRILTAQSMEESREILSQSEPDLILLDLILPEGNGLDFCTYLKAKYPNLPVILLTAKDQVEDKVQGLELGADDYIVKPFETRELLARIRARLRRHREVPSSVPEKITVGDLELDLTNQYARVQGQEIELTPKQFDLLALLIQNRGNLVTRKEIKQKIWGEGQLYAWSRTIDVHIQHLRQKIETDPSQPTYIVTVPRRGYRFQE